jgi:hypothetical protein
MPAQKNRFIIFPETLVTGSLKRSRGSAEAARRSHGCKTDRVA